MKKSSSWKFQKGNQEQKNEKVAACIQESDWKGREFLDKYHSSKEVENSQHAMYLLIILTSYLWLVIF